MIDISNNPIEILDLGVLPQLLDLTCKERDFLKVKFNCPICHTDKIISATSLLRKKSLVCGRCSQAEKMRTYVANNKEAHMTKWKKAVKDKYGVENIAHDKGTQDLKKKSNLKKYGVEYAVAAPQTRKKIVESFTERYGVSAPGSIPAVIEKIEKTHMERYGGWYIGTEEGRKQSMESNNERYGVDYPAQSAEINKKKKATNQERYGVDETFASKELREKRDATMIERYGAVTPMQSPVLKRKMLTNSGHRRTGGFKGYEYEDRSYDSSYELAYYIWLRDTGKKFIYHPDTPLSYIGSDSLEHLFMPDFLVEGIFYEIKGGCFFNKEGEPYNAYSKEFWWEKYNAMIANKVVILREINIKESLDFVKHKYGKNFLKDHKIKKALK